MSRGCRLSGRSARLPGIRARVRIILRPTAATERTKEMRKLVRFFAAIAVAAVFAVGLGPTAQAGPSKLCWVTGNLDCH